MDYKKIYNNIIENAKSLNRFKGDIYYESHHIIPKCLGGLNDKDNLVLLTAKEHYLSHRLLCYIYPNENKIFYAFRMMSLMTTKKMDREYKISAMLYNELKIQGIPSMKGKKHTEDSKKKMSKSHKGCNSAMKGKKQSKEACDKMSKSRKGKDPWNKGKRMNDDFKLKVSEGGKGKKHKFKGRKPITDETRKKLSDRAKEQWIRRKNNN